MVTKYSVAMGLIFVADPDLQIREGGGWGGGGRGGNPDPEIIGGGLKNFFSTFQASVWSKNNGEPRAPRAPRAPLLDSPLNCQPNLKLVSGSYRFSNNTKQWKKTEPP